eukprot:1393707-Rhodomonas_salina.1
MVGACAGDIEVACGFATKIVISTLTRFCQSRAEGIGMQHIPASAWPVPGMVGKEFREVLARQG